MLEAAELMKKALISHRPTLKPLIHIEVNEAGTYATLTVSNDPAEYDAAEPFTVSFSTGQQDAHVHADWYEAWDNGQIRKVELDHDDAYTFAAEQIVDTLDSNEREHISRVEQFGENLDEADWWFDSKV